MAGTGGIQHAFPRDPLQRPGFGDRRRLAQVLDCYDEVAEEYLPRVA
jgi:hypothetical protein